MNISKKWVNDSDEVDDSKATKLSNYQYVSGSLIRNIMEESLESFNVNKEMVNQYSKKQHAFQINTSLKLSFSMVTGTMEWSVCIDTLLKCKSE